MDESWAVSMILEFSLSFVLIDHMISKIYLVNGLTFHVLVSVFAW